jgi:hypothetical protein
MAMPQSSNAPWTRKHDKPGTPLIPQAPMIMYPQSLEDLIAICSAPGGQLRAAGAHWGLSQAAISDDIFVETNDFNNIFPAMGRTLYDVAPACLSDQFLTSLNEMTTNATHTPPPPYFFHMEAGKRIYQAYAEMDVGDDNQPASLCAKMATLFGNKSFSGPWGFPTLGGAGGQTVVGALTTGTHGGDFDRPPIADAVVALHLVVDGGKHYWIERAPTDDLHFTDEAKLRAFYGDAKYGGPSNFDVKYSDDLLNAALVQVGRFGIVYSVVLQVVRQYGLSQSVDNYNADLDLWENVKGQISDPKSALFVQPTADGTPQRFLQVAILPVAVMDGLAHVCSVTRRWTTTLGSLATPPQGRAERVGAVSNPNDMRLNAPRFSKAGVSIPYSPTGNASPDFLQIACADASFLAGIVDAVYTETENFIQKNVVVEGGALAAAVALGGAALTTLVPELALILAILALFLKALEAGLASDPEGQRLGQALDILRTSLLGDPLTRRGGMLIWSAISAKIFKSIQGEENFSALSYAVMDTHDYTDVSCQVNVDSVEVFFAAGDPNLIAFVDRLLQHVTDQEVLNGESPAGYISLRFTGQTRATIGPEAFPNTCAVECSSLVDISGGSDFVAYATTLALDPNIKGILHWGQRNDSTQADTEFRFGDSPSNLAGPLQDWRSALSLLTDNGRLNRFSSAFTRRVGLEIVQPMFGDSTVNKIAAPPAEQYKITWNCSSNPPETQIFLDILSPLGAVTHLGPFALVADNTFATPNSGLYKITLTAALARNGVTRTATRSLTVTA